MRDKNPQNESATIYGAKYLICFIIFGLIFGAIVQFLGGEDFFISLFDYVVFPIVFGIGYCVIVFIKSKLGKYRIFIYLTFATCILFVSIVIFMSFRIILLKFFDKKVAEFNTCVPIVLIGDHKPKSEYVGEYFMIEYDNVQIEQVLSPEVAMQLDKHYPDCLNVRMIKTATGVYFIDEVFWFPSDSSESKNE